MLKSRLDEGNVRVVKVARGFSRKRTRLVYDRLELGIDTKVASAIHLNLFTI